MDERYLDAGRVKRELDPLKRRVADREQEAAEMESRDGARFKANDNILADGKATPQGTQHDHRPQAPGGGDNSSAAAGGAKKGPQRHAQHKFMVNLPPNSQIMIYSEPMTGPGSTPICLIPGGEVLRVVTVRSTYTGHYVWERT